MRCFFNVFFVVLTFSVFAQKANFDVKSYQLDLSIDIENQSISGSNYISFNSLQTIDSLVLYLSANFVIHKISEGEEELKFNFQDGLITIYLLDQVPINRISSIKIFYSGKPQEAKNPPWDGGFVWETDSLNRPWIGVSCEGIGASTWWPTTNDISDKADVVNINVTIPKTEDSLQVVCNGELKNMVHHQDSVTYQWGVSYPITNYNVTLNIGVFEQFQTKYSSQSGLSFPLDYYVLDYHIKQAKKHFRQVPKVLNVFEEMYGNYSFPNDGYALVETSYWGMEHQGAISYGNHFKNDVLGFDFIILHESAHEYWGNAVGINDFADLWINEAFATYTETLFFEHVYSKEIAFKYLKFQQQYIKNTEVLVGKLGENHDFETTDIYYKGAWMLHTIRTALNDDDVFFKVLKEIQQSYKYRTITTNEVLAIFGKHISSFDVRAIFTHYLYNIEYPRLSYSIRKKKQKELFSYQWTNVSGAFNLPIWIKVDGVIRSVKPQEKVFGDKIEVLWLDNYLISTKAD